MESEDDSEQSDNEENRLSAVLSADELLASNAAAAHFDTSAAPFASVPNDGEVFGRPRSRHSHGGETGEK